MKHNALDYVEKLRTVRNTYELEILEAFLGKGARTIQKYIKGEIPINSELHAKIDEAYANSQAGKPLITDTPDKKNPDSIKNQDEQNLADLMKSHKALAYAHQKLADAHQIIAETNRSLSKGAPTEGKPEIDGILDFLLKALAKIGTGTRWQSEDEAIAALNREWLGIQRSGSSKDIPQDQHKQDISR